MTVLFNLMMGRRASGRTVLTGQRWAGVHNDNGECGFGNTNNIATIAQLGDLETWTNKETCGRPDSRLVVNSEGKLYAWGNNGSGQLGLGDTTQRTSPVQVGTDTDWQEAGVTAGGASAIKTNGTLWTWGENNSGALGKGNTTTTNSPSQVGSDTDWFKLMHTGFNGDRLFVMNDAGEIYYAGLGLNGLSTVSSFTQIGSEDGFTDAFMIGNGLVAHK